MSYPGLPSHPQHALMQRLRNADYGFGGILTLDLGSLQAPGSSLLDMEPLSWCRNRPSHVASGVAWQFAWTLLQMLHGLRSPPQLPLTSTSVVRLLCCKR